MMTAKETRPLDIKVLKEGGTTSELIDAIDNVGYDRLLEHEPLIAKYVAAGCPVRGDALKTLIGRWGLPKYLPVAFDALRRDPSEVICGEVITALYLYAKCCDDHREEILREIAVAAVSDHDVAASAYQTFLELVAPERDRDFMDELDFEFDKDRDVDWQLIAPYLPA
jgi:hypothetical protein